jgi:hypothetical protein
MAVGSGSGYTGVHSRPARRRSVGLRLISGAADDAPSTICTLVQFGATLLWTAPVTGDLPMMFAVVYRSSTKLEQVGPPPNPPLLTPIGLARHLAIPISDRPRSLNAITGSANFSTAFFGVFVVAYLIVRFQSSEILEACSLQRSVKITLKISPLLGV